MNKDEIIGEIEALRAVIATGHDRMRENQFIDMELMQSKVEAVCQDVAELAPDDAGDVREALTALLEDLQKYSTSVSEQVGKDQESGAAGDRKD